MLLSGRFRLTCSIRDHNKTQWRASELATEACLFIHPKTSCSFYRVQLFSCQRSLVYICKRCLTSGSGQRCNTCWRVLHCSHFSAARACSKPGLNSVRLACLQPGLNQANGIILFIFIFFRCHVNVRNVTTKVRTYEKQLLIQLTFYQPNICVLTVFPQPPPPPPHQNTHSILHPSRTII